MSVGLTSSSQESLGKERMLMVAVLLLSSTVRGMRTDTLVVRSGRAITAEVL